MDIDKKLESLKKIKKVEAPPFLLTRIMARIEQPAAMLAPKWWRLAFVGASIVVVVLNLALVFAVEEKKNQNAIDQVVGVMALVNSNDLYND